MAGVKQVCLHRDVKSRFYRCCFYTVARKQWIKKKMEIKLIITKQKYA